MNRIPGVIKIHLRDSGLWIFLPWLILLSSFLVNLLVRMTIEMKEDLYTGGLFSIHIYMLVAGVITLVQTFPFSLGLSLRRIDYLTGTTIFVLILSIGHALLLVGFAIVEKLTDNWGMGVHFFNLPYLNDGNLFQQFLIHWIMLINMFFLGFVIASIQRRYGAKGMFVFFGTILLLGSVASILCTYYQKWGALWNWITNHTAFELALWMVPFTVIYIAATYGLLRKSKGV